MKNYTEYVMDRKTLKGMTSDELGRYDKLLQEFTNGALKAAAAFGHICPMTGFRSQQDWIIAELIRYNAEQENRTRENAHINAGQETNMHEDAHVNAEQEARARENARIAFLKLSDDALNRKVSEENATLDDFEHDTELEDAWMDGALQSAAAFGHKCPVKGEAAQYSWIVGEIVRYEGEVENRKREDSRLIFDKFGMGGYGSYKLQLAH